MTMAEIRKGFKERREYYKRTGLDELIDFNKHMQDEVETLYKNGFIRNCSDDFISYCNGYQIKTCDYETCHIYSAFDMRSVEASKNTAREIAEFILNP